MNCAKTTEQRDIGSVNEAVDKESWSDGEMDILETNAYYDPWNNSINIIRDAAAV